MFSSFSESEDFACDIPGGDTTYNSTVGSFYVSKMCNRLMGKPAIKPIRGRATKNHKSFCFENRA